MSVSGIAAGSIFQFLLQPASNQSSFQNFQQEFEQLVFRPSLLAAIGLRLARTSHASDVLRRRTNDSTGQRHDSTFSGFEIGQSHAAQQDDATVQIFSRPLCPVIHHHPHAASSQGSSSNPIDQLFAQLGQALQSGNLPVAQATYTTLQQDFQSLGTPVTGSTCPPVNLSA